MKKTALLIGVSILGCGFIAATLLSTNRLSKPESFAADWHKQGDVAPAIEKVNLGFKERWREKKLDTAERADTLLIARRISLALTGTIPSLEEIRQLESLPEEHRINWWLSYLFEDGRYPKYVAERLARAYVGVEAGPFLVYRRARFVDWLREKLATNQRYDELVRELFTSEGLWTDSPAVNFFTVTIDQNDTEQPDPIRLAARTSRAFLGMRIDCLQCHDDQLGDMDLGDADNARGGTQQDFHYLASFFAEAKSSGTGLRDREMEQYRYKYLGEEEEELVPIAVPYAEYLLPKHGTRREKLAAWMTHPKNRPFARAIVNRMWALLFGKALVDPVDNIPLHEGVPQPLEELADDFIANDYDLQRLIRLIVATDAFQRDWRADFEITSSSEENFAVFPQTRLRPEQVAKSILQAVSLSTINEDSHVIQRLTEFGSTNDFIKNYGDKGENEFEDQSETIAQRLALMNGNLVEANSNANPLLLNSPGQVALLSGSDERAIETVFLAILTRRPSETEKAAFMERTKGLQNDERMKQFEDMFWMYFNSSEFGWNH